METQEKELTPQYTPSDKELDVIQRISTRFFEMRNERDKNRHEYDGDDLETYVEKSMDAYNGIVSEEMKAAKEDWQSVAWDHKTRGKVKAIISMVVGIRPFVSIVGETTEAEVQKLASKLSDVYEDSWDVEKGNYKLYLQVLSAVCKGTVIVEEIYQEDRVKEKEIISVDQETGETTFKEKTKIKGGFGTVRANIIPLLNFYPNENHPEVEEDCCLVEDLTEAKFKSRYGKFPNFEFVRKGVTASLGEEQPQYKSYIEDTKDLIRVIKYYNEYTDEFVIMANGVWLNPQKGDVVCPIPFKHKKLPFAKMIFEVADEECFYGKSLPDLTKGEQDPTNALLRLMIDQEILAVQRPILVGQGAEIGSNMLSPGKINRINGDINQVREMLLQGASQGGFQMLQLLRGNMNENTAIDPISQGVHGYGSGRKTARESVILDENSKKSNGPLLLHVYKFLHDRAVLRISNIKQFYINAKSTKDKDKRTITVKKPGERPKWITLDEEIRDTEFKITLVEDFEVSQSKSVRREEADELLSLAKENPMIEITAVTQKWLISRGLDPEKYFKEPDPGASDLQNEQQGVINQPPAPEVPIQ